MIYKGFFSTAEGSHNREPYEFNSVRKAAKTMRAIAYGNCLIGSTAKWTVMESDGNIVKSGTIK